MGAWRREVRMVCSACGRSEFGSRRILLRRSPSSPCSNWLPLRMVRHLRSWLKRHGLQMPNPEFVAWPSMHTISRLNVRKLQYCSCVFWCIARGTCLRRTRSGTWNETLTVPFRRQKIGAKEEQWPQMCLRWVPKRTFTDGLDAGACVAAVEVLKLLLCCLCLRLRHASSPPAWNWTGLAGAAGPAVLYVFANMAGTVASKSIDAVTLSQAPALRTKLLFTALLAVTTKPISGRKWVGIIVILLASVLTAADSDGQAAQAYWIGTAAAFASAMASAVAAVLAERALLEGRDPQLLELGSMTHLKRHLASTLDASMYQLQLLCEGEALPEDQDLTDFTLPLELLLVVQALRPPSPDEALRFFSFVDDAAVLELRRCLQATRGDQIAGGWVRSHCMVGLMRARSTDFLRYSLLARSSLALMSAILDVSELD
eukprot:g65.t1